MSEVGRAAGEVIERHTTADGTELLLTRRGAELEVSEGGKIVMSSDARRSEKSLAELGLAPLRRDDMTVLIAGLGMGFTLRAVLDMPGVVRVDVVEVSETIVEWNRKYFGALNGNPLDDPRVHLHIGDLMGFLKQVRYTPLEDVKEGWLAFLLDVDNGPSLPSRAANAVIYSEEGLKRLEAALRHGGVCAIWSAQRELEFLQVFNARFMNVAELAVPVEVGGVASLDYIYRGRRRPEPKSGTGNPPPGMAQA